MIVLMMVIMLMMMMVFVDEAVACRHGHGDGRAVVALNVGSSPN